MNTEEMLDIVTKANTRLHDEVREWRVRAVAAEAELREARAEITRHHRDFAEVQRLAEKTAECLKRDGDGIMWDDPDPIVRNVYVNSARTWVQDMRNIVG